MRDVQQIIGVGLLGRFMRAEGISTLAQLEEYIARVEKSPSTYKQEHAFVLAEQLYARVYALERENEELRAALTESR